MEWKISAIYCISMVKNNVYFNFVSNLLFRLRLNYDNVILELYIFKMRYFSWLDDGLASDECQFNRRIYRLWWSWSSLRSFLCQVESFMSYDMQDIVMSHYVTSCHGVWRDLGFENVKHGLISYHGNQGRGIFHASYLSPVPVRFFKVNE